MAQRENKMASLLLSSSPHRCSCGGSVIGIGSCIGSGSGDDDGNADATPTDAPFNDDGEMQKVSTYTSYSIKT